ncbi:MAG TPA: alpha/beta fold hydrolase [Gemmatimonadaceae bacterium]|nr:alpha/beta fold hydrolase [Gemmatimonadaceae bacterium]
MTRSLAILLLVAAPAATTSAQPTTPAPGAMAHGFVVLAGDDTIALERVTRTGDRVRGELLVRARNVRQTYDLALDDGGIVRRLETATYRAGAPTGTLDEALHGQQPVQHVVLVFDSTGVAISAGPQSHHFTAPRDALPFLNLSGGDLEQIFRRARALSGDAPQVPLFILQGGGSLAAPVRWVGADSAVLTIGGVELRAHVGPDGALLGAVVPAQRVRFVRTATAPSLAVAAPDYSAPPGAPYTAEEVTVVNPAGGVRLAGTLTMPRHAAGARVPAVVLITGSGAQDRDEGSGALPGWRPFRAIADTLGRRGIAVLRLDDRGIGGSQPGPPGATSADLAGDVRAALAYLRSRPDIDARRLALLGHSEGGLIAPMVAAGDRALRAVVLVAAPAWTGVRISDMQVAQALDALHVGDVQRDSLLRLNTRARDSLAALQPWLRFWLAYDPLPTARRVRQPVLIVQGATDHQVSPEQAGELAAAIRAGGNGDVTVRLFPDVNHLLVHDPSGAVSGYGSLSSYAVAPAVLGAIADWLAARLE